MAGGQPVSDGELAAVLSALAGVRRGDEVAGLGLSPVATRALAAGCGHDLLDGATDPVAAAAVVVVGAVELVEAGRALLRSGGRLVAVAQDESRARATADALGLTFRFAESVGPFVVWSAQAPA